VLEAVTERVSKLRVGDPMSEESEMGPLNSTGQLNKVMGFIDSGREEGARLMTGGERPVGEMFRAGNWVRPTVFADVAPTIRIWRDEIFGPVLSVTSWRDIDEAMSRANGLEYGLTAATWTRDLKNALNAARRIRSGHIWINTVGPHYLGVPYGGMKNSGLDVRKESKRCSATRKRRSST
jgi:aldehyde dehydrogenase (NAD+)/betaine-aldehyde dehydrogenase